MSTLERPDRRVYPPLVAGERLDRATFHERYEAMPPGTRAELIGGIVFMPSPLGVEHGERDSDLSDWLGLYKRRTPGVRKALNATTQFNDYGEPQPDLQLRIPEALGGQTRVEKGFIVGAPELVVEVSKTTRTVDLDAKKSDYERAGIREYVFVGLDPQEILWFVRRDGGFAEQPPDPDGIHRSEAFPGLWFDSQAFFAEDMDRVFAVLEQGLATPAHAAFAAQLAARAGGA